MPIRPVEIMEKHTYDPDKDGIIALAQLVEEVCNNADTDMKVAAEAAARVTDVDTEETARIADVNAEETARINALNTHTELPAAHHTKTVDASELTAGILALTRLSGITNTQIAAAAAIAYTKLALTGKIKAADIEAAAGIPLTKLESAVCSETEADGKITTHETGGKHRWTDEKLRKGAGAGANPDEIDVPLSGQYKQATVALFQTNPATGTAPNPERINDNDTGTWSSVEIIGQYCEIDFGEIVTIRRWRQFGSEWHDGDGDNKIEYFDIPTQSWVDWVTGIATRTTNDWSDFITEAIIACQKIRITVLIIDTQKTPDKTRLHEWEVIY